MLIALLPLVGMAYYYYGVRSLFLILIGAGTCWITDLLCALMTRRKVDVRDVSPLITGLILSLMLPAAAPYWMPIVGGVFAVALVKQAFGGLGNNIFNPAAGGVAFLSICFPAQMFSYSAPFASLELWTNEVSATLQQSPANMLKYGGMPSLTTMDLVLGNFAGPMGTTNLLVMVACLCFYWCVRPLIFVFLLLLPLLWRRFPIFFPDFLVLLLLPYCMNALREWYYLQAFSWQPTLLLHQRQKRENIYSDLDADYLPCCSNILALLNWELLSLYC